MTTMNPATGSSSGDLSWIEPRWADDELEIDLGPRIRTQLISVCITIAVLVAAVVALTLLS